MIIKCSKHSDCDATLICLQCGFLCSKDTYDEDKRKHNLLFVSGCIKNLYNAIYELRQVQQQSAFSSLLKESIDDFFHQEANRDEKKGKAALANVQKCLLYVQGINKESLEAVLEEATKKIFKIGQKSNENEKKKLIHIIAKYLQTKELSEKPENNYRKRKIYQIQNMQEVETRKKKYVPDPNVESAIVKFTESEWHKKYEQILKKYDSKNTNIQCAVKILENNTKKEGEIVIKFFLEKCYQMMVLLQ